MLANFRCCEVHRCHCHAYCSGRVGCYYETDFRHKNARRQVVSSFFYNFFFMKLIKFVDNLKRTPSEIMKKNNGTNTSHLLPLFWCVFNLVQRLLIWKLLLAKKRLSFLCSVIYCGFLFTFPKTACLLGCCFFFAYDYLSCIYFVSLCQNQLFACYKTSLLMKSVARSPVSLSLVLDHN